MEVHIKVCVYLKYRPENILYLDTFFQLTSTLAKCMLF